MTPRDFAKLVIEMRAAQSAYFRSRDGDAMRRAKALERRVDLEAPDIANPSEPDLFGGPAA